MKIDETIQTGSYLKNRIFVQGQGGAEFQPAGILKYVEELKRGSNTDIGPKDFFEIASSNVRLGILMKTCWGDMVIAYKYLCSLAIVIR